MNDKIRVRVWLPTPVLVDSTLEPRGKPAPLPHIDVKAERYAVSNGVLEIIRETGSSGLGLSKKRALGIPLATVGSYLVEEL